VLELDVDFVGLMMPRGKNSKGLIPLPDFKYKMKEMEAGSQKRHLSLNFPFL